MLRFFRPNRRRGSANRAPLANMVQPLEARSLLTGTVTVAISGQSVTVTGTDSNDEVEIVFSPDKIAISGDHGTKIKFYGVVSDQAELPGDTVAKDLVINMKGGNDTVQIVTDESNGNVRQLGKDLKIDMGSGNDRLVVTTETGSLSVGGRLNVMLGAGDDCFIGGQYDAIREALYGDGNPSHDQFRVQRDVSVQGNAGNDKIGLAGMEIGGKLSLDGGDQKDVMGLSEMNIFGNLEVKGGDGNDDFASEQLNIQGKTNMDLGKGDDRVAFEGGRTGQSQTDVTISLGAGNDKLAIASDITINGKLDGGPGRDQLAIYFPRGKLSVKGFEEQADSYADQTDAYDDLRIDIGADVIDALRQCLQS